MDESEQQRPNLKVVSSAKLARGPPEIINLQQGIKVRPIFLFALMIVLSGCASTAPTPIGHDTYYSSKTNTAGIFGDVTAVAGSLMAQGSQFCASKGREFELVTTSTTQNVPGVRFGGASITFKCTEHAKDPVMRRDNGVTTVN